MLRGLLGLVAGLASVLAMSACGQSVSTPSGEDSSATSDAGTSRPSVSIPLRVTETNGLTKTMVSVGGGPEIPVVVDTGSSGLRVFASKVGSEVSRTGETLPTGYQGGLVMESEHATAPLTLSGCRLPGQSLLRFRTQFGVKKPQWEVNANSMSPYPRPRASTSQPRRTGFWGLGSLRASRPAPQIHCPLWPRRFRLTPSPWTVARMAL